MPAEKTCVTCRRHPCHFESYCHGEGCVNWLQNDETADERSPEDEATADNDGNAEVSYSLQRLAREQMKKRILADILCDLAVCDIEGWSKTEYIAELKQMLDGINDNPR